MEWAIACFCSGGCVRIGSVFPYGYRRHYYYYYYMALYWNADLRLLNGLLSILFFDLSFQFLILYLLISLCTQFSHMYIRRGYRGYFLENL
jgi:hypothetical protein